MPASLNILFDTAVTKGWVEVWCEDLLRRRAKSNLWQADGSQRKEGGGGGAAAAGSGGAVEDCEYEYNSGILKHVIRRIEHARNCAAVHYDVTCESKD